MITGSAVAISNLIHSATHRTNAAKIIQLEITDTDIECNETASLGGYLYPSASSECNYCTIRQSSLHNYCFPIRVHSLSLDTLR